MKKILGISSIRSDYDLMSGVYSLLDQDKEIELKLLVSGAHLCYDCGYTVKEIKRDGFSILKEINTLPSGRLDARSVRPRAAGLFLHEAVNAVEEYKPDAVIYSGDREDVMVGALLGGYLRITTAHFFGGDHTTDGNIDNSVRLAASKLSSLHFVTLPEHKQRLLSIGEREERIFVVGNPALDRFFNPRLPDIKQLMAAEFSLDYRLWNDYCILIFHPLLGEEIRSGEQMTNILQCLLDRNIRTFISYPNIDAGNKGIIKASEEFFKKYPDTFYLYKNLPRDSFVALYKNCRFIIGNSSCGILESATAGVPAINVGSRQRGRVAPKNVYFCGDSRSEILKALDTVGSPQFCASKQDWNNPYGDGKSVERIYRLLKELDFNRFVVKDEDPLWKV